jgi:hypothetical protein
VGVGGLAAAAIRLPLLPPAHVALLHILDLARRREVRLLELRAQLSLRRGQLALAPELAKVIVHVYVECGRVRVHGLGGVVLLLADEQDLVLRGEGLELGDAVGPAILQVSHLDSQRVGESGEVRLHLLAVCDGVDRVVAVHFLAVGGFVLGDEDDAIVAVEGALDVRCVLLECDGKGEVVDDVGQCGTVWESVFEVFNCVDHVGHDLGSGSVVVAAEGRRWGCGGV